MLLAGISDFKTYKIRNKLIYPFIVLGLAVNIFFKGAGGIVFSLWGLTIPILFLILLFALRMLGAGDIKLFSAIGSIMGASFVFDTMLYSFLVGGILCTIIILLRKNAHARLRHLYNYFKTCLLNQSFLPYTDFSDKTDGAKFHVSYAIALGTAMTFYFRIFM